MAETGWALAGNAGSTSPGSTAWTNPGRVTAADGSYTEGGAWKSNRDTQYLRARQFGFSIPVDATIDGIRVRYRWYAADNNVFHPTTVQLAPNWATRSGDNLGSSGIDIPTSAGDQTFGGEAVLWGLSPTPSDVNNSDFAVYLRINYSGSSPTSVAVFVDAIWMNVNYTETGSKVPVKDSGVWKESDPYVKDGGIWKPAEFSVKDAGIWKEV